MQVKEKGFLMQDQGLQEEEKELEKKIVQEKRYNSQILKYNVGNELVQNEQNIIFVKSKLNMSNFQIEEEYDQMEMEGEIMGSEYIQFYNFLQQQIITIPIQLKEN
ncbi:hypothetical protein PPERSA_07620 [Pseudocohnilembus persalinus]|uniref:Uncharacterized protein n=1 Tax=Pseudocohnilembus persalinus TaxID=266149 RepID=A0A0V0QIH6_PSEPJ|nr:hypothetical protein PPERSA_07620 [Pseudocohnilembus persalinus]|eukprot:KRX01975.1 hypothetical protein PPERSA_07620 [Pseudocohnilembus persalinus]